MSFGMTTLNQNMEIWRVKLLYMDTDSFVTHNITGDFYEDIADDI